MVIRSRTSKKDKTTQCSKDKGINNLQNTSQKTKDRATRNPVSGPFALTTHSP